MKKYNTLKSSNISAIGKTVLSFLGIFFLFIPFIVYRFLCFNQLSYWPAISFSIISGIVVLCVDYYICRFVEYSNEMSDFIDEYEKTLESNKYVKRQLDRYKCSFSDLNDENEILFKALSRLRGEVLISSLKTEEKEYILEVFEEISEDDRNARILFSNPEAEDEFKMGVLFAELRKKENESSNHIF